MNRLLKETHTDHSLSFHFCSIPLLYSKRKLIPIVLVVSVSTQNGDSSVNLCNDNGRERLVHTGLCSSSLVVLYLLLFDFEKEINGDSRSQFPLFSGR